jgi:HEAT repeat protein
MTDQIQQLIAQLNGGVRPRRRAVSQLIRLGEPAVEPLIAELESTDDRTIQYALTVILGKIGDKRAASVLGTMLNIDDYFLSRLVVLR